MKTILVFKAFRPIAFLLVFLFLNNLFSPFFTESDVVKFQTEIVDLETEDSKEKDCEEEDFLVQQKQHSPFDIQSSQVKVTIRNLDCGFIWKSPILEIWVQPPIC